MVVRPRRRRVLARRSPRPAGSRRRQDWKSQVARRRRWPPRAWPARRTRSCGRRTRHGPSAPAHSRRQGARAGEPAPGADLIEVGHFIVVTSRTAVTACSSTSAGIVGTCLDLVRRRSGCPTHRPGVEGYLASMPVFALWSAPRARSTAFVRSMVERGDLIALHEPFCNRADFGRPISKGGRSVQPRRSSPGCVIRPMTSGCS